MATNVQKQSQNNKARKLIVTKNFERQYLTKFAEDFLTNLSKVKTSLRWLMVIFFSTPLGVEIYRNDDYLIKILLFLMIVMMAGIQFCQELLSNGYALMSNDFSIKLRKFMNAVITVLIIYDVGHCAIFLLVMANEIKLANAKAIVFWISLLSLPTAIISYISLSIIQGQFVLSSFPPTSETHTETSETSELVSSEGNSEDSEGSETPKPARKLEVEHDTEAGKRLNEMSKEEFIERYLEVIPEFIKIIENEGDKLSMLALAKRSNIGDKTMKKIFESYKNRFHVKEIRESLIDEDGNIRGSKTTYLNTEKITDNLANGQAEKINGYSLKEETT